jgi:hypothetical protein
MRLYHNHHPAAAAALLLQRDPQAADLASQHTHKQAGIMTSSCLASMVRQLHADRDVLPRACRRPRTTTLLLLLLVTHPLHLLWSYCRQLPVILPVKVIVKSPVWPD